MDSEILSSTPDGPLRVTVLRLTAFFQNADELTSSRWWHEVFDEEADSRTQRPQLGFLQETGVVDGKSWLMTTQGTRVDWILLPRTADHENPEPEQAIGTIEESVRLFNARIPDWLGGLSTNLDRLAIGLIAEIPVATRKEAYEHLAAALRNVKIDVENTSEFTYQINRPQSSETLEGVSINRLGKWTATMSALMQLQPSGDQLYSAVQATANQIAARFEADVSTGVETHDLPTESFLQLYEELMTVAVSIVVEGEK